MQQYFIQGIIQPHSLVSFDAEQLHHITHVMRMREHDRLCLVDEGQNVYLGELVLVEGTWYASLISQLETVKSDVSITLALALIKKERWDYALQKCSELGVSEIRGLITSRCVVKWKQAEAEKKLMRWNRITREACEQCRRSDLVRVKEPWTLSQLMQASADLKLIAYEKSDAASEHILSIIRKYPNVKSILAVIGPEGGFEANEVQQLIASGFHCVSLGKRILRAETAALSVVNLLSSVYENEIRGVTNEEYRGNPQ